MSVGRTRRWVGLAAILAAGALPACGDDSGEAGERPASPDVTRSGGAPRFSAPRRIDNPYLPLAKFRRCELRCEEGGAPARVVRRVLDRVQRFRIGGRTVGALVIEDRAFESGRLVERTLDYFAQADDGTVHYLGEDVNNYEDGRLKDHNGTWRFGRETDTLGVAMPARPRVGTRWRFEDVPGLARESDRVVQRLERVRIGRRVYEDVLRVRERIEPEDHVEFKLYAKGTGVIREQPPDGKVELVRCS